MSDNSNNENNTGKKVFEVIGRIMTPDNLQNYVLGYKKNGRPRAIYDIVKDQTEPRRSGGKKKKKPDKFSLYIGPTKKSKKKKKKKDHWRWDD